MLERAKTLALSLVNNRQMLLVLIALVAFIGATIFVYKTYISKRLDNSYAPNKEFIPTGADSKSLDLYYFYTEWCPHCKKAKPEWESLKSSVGNAKVNGYGINFIEVDCDKDSAMADKFNVEGYPTIKASRTGTIIEFDAKPQINTLTKFLESITNN